jgi:hypothetical protein
MSIITDSPREREKIAKRQGTITDTIDRPETMAEIPRTKRADTKITVVPLPWAFPSPTIPAVVITDLATDLARGLIEIKATLRIRIRTERKVCVFSLLVAKEGKRVDHLCA